MYSRQHRRHRGFTLVELLVVIGIIALLISLLIPVLYKGREAGYRTSCASQLKEVGTAVMMYVNDNKGTLPKPSKVAPDPNDALWWQNSRIRDINVYGLGRYLQLTRSNLRILRCPSDDQAPQREDQGKYPFTYSFNDNMGGDGIQAVKKLNQVRNAAEKILAFEENGPTLDDASAKLWNVKGAWNGISLLGLRHDRARRNKYPDASNATTGVPNIEGFGNVAFADGHVAYVPRTVAQAKSSVLPNPLAYPNDPEIGP